MTTDTTTTSQTKDESQCKARWLVLIPLIPIACLTLIAFCVGGIESNLNSLLVFTLGFTALLIFYMTKTTGFGPYNTATLIVVLVTTMSGLLYFANGLDPNTMQHILFAIIGFAGGLFAGGKDK